MGLIIDKEDFTGKYAIAQNSFTDIDSYITKYEEKYLIDLFGVELFKLFKASVTSQVPGPGVYKTIYDPILEDEGECIRKSEGIKTMLLGFVWFEFIRDQKYKATVSGHHVGATENSREASFDELNIYGRYNESIESYKTIQWYIEEHETEYPDYNGQCKGLAHWAL